MAKVSKLDIRIKGENTSIPIKCNSKGLFSAELPQEIVDTGIYKTVTGNTLDEVVRELRSKISAYETTIKKIELCLVIVFACSGEYYRNIDGKPFNYNGFDEHLYKESGWGRSARTSTFCFDFFPVFKEEMGNKTFWYKASIPHRPEEVKDLFANKYFKDSARIDLPSGNIIIPYSEEAFNKLEIARENIRKVSEILYNFVNQEEKLIQEQLEKPGQLLLENKE